MKIETGLLQRLRDEARQAAPLECCGLLLGRHKDEICSLEPYPGPLYEHRFDISDEWLLKQHYEARASELKVVGYYHSHPTGSGEPSVRDLRGHPAGATCLIIDRGGQIRLFTLAREGPASERIVSYSDVRVL
ncbi:MAG: Mov34/MPN/PAD-1 family protein [Candidatus Eremiobacteraeota bacterium]|nr:Mov34/MPN/PAD-1 family protein [Candidatus Eremiobacteraeota bacterium]